MKQRAFAPAPGYEELSGATIVHGPDGLTIDLMAALDAGDGVLVTDDPGLAAQLDAHEAFVDAVVPEDPAVVQIPQRAPGAVEDASAALEAVHDKAAREREERERAEAAELQRFENEKRQVAERAARERPGGQAAAGAATESTTGQPRASAADGNQEGS